jgi:hypothetical protein
MADRVAPLVVLVPSPLVGSATWQPVAAALGARGVATAIAVLADDGDAAAPFWQQHAHSAAASVAASSSARPLFFVGHSGAGPLLPAISAAVGWRAAGYLFVDAGLPVDGQSRFALMRREDAEFAARFRALLDAGGRFPTWSEDDLRDLIPDARLRRETVAGLRPRGAAFFDEPITVFAGWPDAPCSYLRLSRAYNAPAAEARARGWPLESIDAGHFHMLVDPDAIADAIMRLAARCGVALANEP